MMFWIIAGVLSAGVTLCVIRPLGHTRLALALIVLIPGLALGLYLWLGRPDLTAWHGFRSLPPEMTEAVARLQQDVKADPNDADALVLLADIHRKIGDYKQARDEFRRAIALRPAMKGLQLALGETIIALNGGVVDAEALTCFQAIKDDEQFSPPARYYVALARSQAGDWQAAYDSWRALSSLPPSPLTPLVAARLDEAKQALNLNTH